MYNNPNLKRYNLLNNIFGWVAFLIAATTYLLTIEPTASFWDCGEFITSSYKLEVGHPPGAPFFMLTAKFFTLFASDVTQVAMMVNVMSAIMSALTILFLFWTITHLTRKLLYTEPEKEMSLSQIIVILGSGMVGALAYTFSDTFWFSAVEAEVYAYSSMCTALVFWLILKWENRADEPRSDKWLVIIAYAMGLSIGVHLLNLLCIPAIVLVYYFKKNKAPNLLGTVIALLVSFLLIVVLMYGIIPGFSKVGGWFELLFVNTFGLSYNSGTFAYIILLAGSIAWGLFESFSSKGDLTRAKIAFVLSMTLSGAVLIGSVILGVLLLIGLVAFVFVYKGVNFRLLNTTLLCLLVILVGYSSFALIPIRSIANTPMDQNSPEHVFSLASYLNREQYGDRPLIYGKTYASKELRDSNGRLKDPIDEKTSIDKIPKKSETEKDRYIVSTTIPSYDVDNKMLFPRMHSKESRHLMGYRMWGGVENTSVQPTMMENLKFFFSYQLDYMYFRYFMWNFSGRQNDIQGDGSISKGNWITGIGIVDELLGRGPQDDLPPDIGENKGHNSYFALPLILGLLGILLQVMCGSRGEKQFLVTFMLFFMTGIAIILYLNQQPFEPRERDYAYAGSFYAFSIWIGMGVASLWKLLKKDFPELIVAIIVVLLTLVVPIRMAAENWDDHDRSERYTMRDFAKNYLDTCEPNAILFTMGDNDTFPLWYIQEVEGFRTDVRVCNLSYLQTDWYVDQMRRQSYESEPLPISWTGDRYLGDKGQAAHMFSKKDLENIILRDVAGGNVSEAKSWLSHMNFNKYFDTKAFTNEMDLGEALEILKTKDNYVPRNPFVEKGVVIPSSKFTTSMNPNKVDWKGLNTKPDSTFTIDFGDNKGAIYRQEMMIMEMIYNISNDDWKRPMYYALTIGSAPLNLKKQSALEGIDYRILPGKIDSTGVNVDKMFTNLMEKYKWGGIDNPKVYLDENNLRMIRSFRYIFGTLVASLIEKGDYERAKLALDKCIEVIPGNTVPRGQESLIYADSYYVVEDAQKANQVIAEILDRTDRTLDWYSRLDPSIMFQSSADIREHLDVKLQVLDIYQRHDSARYDAMLKEVLPQIDTFLANRVVFSDQMHPLDVTMRIIIRNYMYKQDSADDKGSLAAEMEQVAGMMNRYKPELLQKYFRK